MNTKLNKILLAGALAAFGFSMRAVAAPVVLVPGTSLPMTAVLNSPSAVLVASQTDAFSAATISGTVTASVFKNDPNNPWNSSGGLTFEYQIFNSKTSVDAITGMGIDGWLGYSTDVNYVSIVGGVIHPAFATRSLDATTVTFGWQDPTLGTGLVRLGVTSDTVVIYSNAKAWDLDTAGVRDGSGATISIFGPAGIPDGGTTALLLGLGLIGMSWTFRRSRKA